LPGRTGIELIVGIRGDGEMAADSGLATTVVTTLPEHVWWGRSQRSIPQPYLELIQAESDAARITHFHPIFVPGLLQTRAYATAITPATTLKRPSPEDVEALVDVRMQRQRKLLHRPIPVRLTAIVDETVLRRPVGSNATMRAQLDHLIQLLEDGSVELVVVPTAAGPHPGHLGAFMLIEYDDWRVEGVLCFEGQSGNVVLRDRPDLVAEYKRLADRLVDMGLRTQAAKRLVQSALQAFI
jgi:hypothetical protein